MCTDVLPPCPSSVVALCVLVSCHHVLVVLLYYVYVCTDVLPPCPSSVVALCVLMSCHHVLVVLLYCVYVCTGVMKLICKDVMESQCSSSSAGGTRARKYKASGLSGRDKDL